MAASSSRPLLGVLIAQHPAINHAVILREIRELRKYFEVQVASVRAPDRPDAKLTEEERDEARQTYYVKPHGMQGALAAHGRAFFSRPGAYLSGLVYALGWAGWRPKRLLFHLGYFTQALMVGRWMQAKGIRHLHVHYASTIGLLLRRVFPIRLSISFHGPDEFRDPEGFRIREKVRASAFVRAISYYARSQLMMFSDPADWDKIKVVYMGVDPAVFSPGPPRGESNPVELICVGRLAPVKAQQVLIAATDRVMRAGRSVMLHIVGGGPDRAHLEAEVARRNLGAQVRFHGFLHQDELDELYRTVDVFVLASFAEGVPGVLMEAMAMEIPCVSTWITGTPELIRNGIDGLLAAPSDEEGFAEAIMRLVDDPELRRDMGRAARCRILEKFNLPVNSAALAGLLAQKAS